MTELAYRPDQPPYPQQPVEQFVIPTAPIDEQSQLMPEIPNHVITGADNSEIANATAAAREAAADRERLVYQHPERGTVFEVNPGVQEPRPIVLANQTIEEAYQQDIVDEREAAAARQAEHAATEAEQVQAIAWNAEAINATRNYAEEYGLTA